MVKQEEKIPKCPLPEATVSAEKDHNSNLLPKKLTADLKK